MNKEVILNDLLKEIRKNYQLLKKGAEFVHKETALSASARGLIEILNEQGPTTVPHLAKIRYMTRQSVQVAVDQMVELGWVETKQNPFHKKSVLVQLTESGKKALKSMIEQEMKQMKQLDVDIPVKKLEETLKYIHMLNQKIAKFLSSEL